MIPKFYVDKKNNQFFVSAIGGDSDDKVSVSGLEFGDVRVLIDALNRVFGYDIEIVRIYGPERPNDDSLAVAKAVVDFARRVGRESHKIDMIKTYRELTSQGLKESKDAIEYVLYYS